MEERFNPIDNEKYKKVEDLPEKHRGGFIDIPEEDGGGFVRRETLSINRDFQERVGAENKHRSFLNKLLHRGEMSYLDVAKEEALEYENLFKIYGKKFNMSRQEIVDQINRDVDEGMLYDERELKFFDLSWDDLIKSNLQRTSSGGDSGYLNPSTKYDHFKGAIKGEIGRFRVNLQREQFSNRDLHSGEGYAKEEFTGTFDGGLDEVSKEQLYRRLSILCVIRDKFMRDGYYDEAVSLLRDRILDGNDLEK